MVKASKFLDPANWILPTRKEIADYLGNKKRGAGTVMFFQKNLTPVDVYSYLRSSFGEPNGFANFLRRDDSSNLIHWHYDFKCDDVFIIVMGINRSVQFAINKKLSKNDWQELVINFRKCFSERGREKSAAKNALEEWALFINRYYDLCSVAASYYETVDSLKDFNFKMPIIPKNKKSFKKWEADVQGVSRDFSNLQDACLSLKLITPVLLEAFINLLILMMCKKEVRSNTAIYQARIEEHIHVKVQSLHLTCENFKTPINVEREEYKNFKRIMDSRNWFFHGNADPQKDKLETVYFDGKIPIYKDGGNVYEKLYGTMLDMIKPDKILSDYIKAHEFIGYVINCLDEKCQAEVWHMVDSQTLGYNIKEDRFGILFSNILVSSNLPDVLYDENLFDE